MDASRRSRSPPPRPTVHLPGSRQDVDPDSPRPPRSPHPSSTRDAGDAACFDGHFARARDPVQRRHERSRVRCKDTSRARRSNTHASRCFRAATNAGQAREPPRPYSSPTARSWRSARPAHELAEWSFVAIAKASFEVMKRTKAVVSACALSPLSSDGRVAPCEARMLRKAGPCRQRCPAAAAANRVRPGAVPAGL